MMDRRQLVGGLSAAASMALAGGAAQSQPGQVRRVGVMMALSASDPEGPVRYELFRRALAEAGWVEGRNVTFDTGWYGGNLQAAQDLARRFIADKVDVVLANGAPGLDALTKLGAALPIVFVLVSNPVGGGYVSNLSRPGANVTGFSTFEPEIAGKWLQLLRQVVPGLKNVNMLLEPRFTSFNSLWDEIAATAPGLGIAAHAAYTSNLTEIEQALERIATQEAPGLIVAPNPVSTVNRQRVVAIANARRIPAICPYRFYLRDGALITYGFNADDQFRRSAGYVARVLNGEKAGDLPVQAPSHFELGLNLKTARDLALTVPQSLLVSAAEVVE